MLFGPILAPICFQVDLSGLRPKDLTTELQHVGQMAPSSSSQESIFGFTLKFPEELISCRLFPACPLHVRGGLVRLSQTIEPICPTEHDREEDEIDRHENVHAWWWRAVEAN